MRRCRIVGRSAASRRGWSRFALLEPNIGEAPFAPARGHPVAHRSGDADVFREKDQWDDATFLEQAALFGEALLGVDERLRVFGCRHEMKLFKKCVELRAGRKGIVVPGE